MNISNWIYLKSKIVVGRNSTTQALPSSSSAIRLIFVFLDHMLIIIMMEGSNIICSKVFLCNIIMQSFSRVMNDDIFVFLQEISWWQAHTGFSRGADNNTEEKTFKAATFTCLGHNCQRRHVKQLLRGFDKIQGFNRKKWRWVQHHVSCFLVGKVIKQTAGFHVLRVRNWVYTGLLF